MKYRKNTCEQAREYISAHGLIDYGGSTLTDFLKSLGIDQRTYYRWLRERRDFADAIEQGREAYKKTLTLELSVTLAQTAKGYDKVLEETEYTPDANDANRPRIRKMRRRTVHYAPNVGAAIFLLTNLDPEHYQQRQRNDIHLRDRDDNEMTIDEINAEIARLDKLNSKDIDTKEDNE